MDHVLLINSDKMEPIEYLKRNIQAELSVITRNKYAHLYKDIANVWIVDNFTDYKVVKDKTLEILKKGMINSVITPTEKSLLAGGFLRSFFAISGPKFDCVLNFSNKLIMKNTLSSHGIAVAAYRMLPSIEDLPQAAKTLGYPIVVKPIMGAGSENTFFIESMEQYKQLFNNGFFDSLTSLDVPLLAEEYVVMDAEYHCDGVVENGKTIFTSISKYFSPVLSSVNKYIGSYILDKESVDYQEIHKIHKNVIRVFCLENGVTHLEVFKTSNGYIVGEITCRPGGGGIPKTIKYNYGFDVWDTFMNLALHKKVNINDNVDSGNFGWFGLPIENGLVTSVPEMNTNMKENNIEGLDLFYKTGDWIESKKTSGSYSGYVFFRKEKDKDLKTITEFIKSNIKVKINSRQYK